MMHRTTTQSWTWGVATSAMLSLAGLVAFAQSAPPPAPAVPAAAAPQVGRGGGRNPNEGADFSPRPAVPPKSGADEAKSFMLPPGYRMELVLAEPDVVSPAVIEFDGNGRMYVVEFVSYMRDADGNGAHDPISRITRFPAPGEAISHW